MYVVTYELEQMQSKQEACWVRQEACLLPMKTYPGLLPVCVTILC